MVKVCTKDADGNEIYAGDKFRVASCCVRDGVPSWYEGLIGKVEEIGLDRKIECEFYVMPLESKTLSVDAFKKHCTKYEPESTQQT